MIETIKTLRRSAAQALADAIAAPRNEHPSEVELRDAFDGGLSKAEGTSKEGWYQPPPKGIIIAIGNPPEYERLSQPTFRVESTWPSGSERLNHESIVYAYSSRVDLQTGLIGDIACSLYSGTNDVIRAHMLRVWEVTHAIANTAEVGISLSALYKRAVELIADAGFENNIYSVHEGLATNIGHTIPWSYEPINEDEQNAIGNGSPKVLADLISNKRRYVSAAENLEIMANMAFTVEPRLSAPGLPPVSFHLVVGFEDSKKAVVTEFQPLFELFKMQNFKTPPVNQGRAETANQISSVFHLDR